MVGKAGKEFSNTEALLFLLISRQMRKTSRELLRKPVRSALELGKPKDWSSVSAQGRLRLRFGLVSWCQHRESLGSDFSSLDTKRDVSQHLDGLRRVRGRGLAWECFSGILLKGGKTPLSENWWSGFLEGKSYMIPKGETLILSKRCSGKP